MWVRVDDQVPHHPKLLQAGPLAGWLWLCGNCHCQAYLTDGFIAEASVKGLSDIRGNVQALVNRLVGAGLWERVEGGYRVHDFHDHNPRASDVKAKREADRLRKESARNLNGHKPDSTRNPERSRARDPQSLIPNPQSPSVPPERVPKEPAPTREFLKWFESEYPKRLSGAKYTIRWEKDGPLVRGMLAVHGGDRLRKLAVMLLVTDEEWVQGTDRGIGILSSKINWLETRLAAWEARHGPTQAAQ